MTRKLFESLAERPAPGDPWDEAAEAVPPLLRALARQGALQRAGQELADEEFHQGFWVDSEDVPTPEAARMAAQDRPNQTIYASGHWRVRVWRSDAALHATQDGGPNGGTLVIGSSSAAVYVALEPGVDVELPHMAPLPDSLVLLEPGGRRVVLQIEVSAPD